MSQIVATSVVDGPINGTVFRAYIEQFLAPTLRPDEIVVLNNLGSHRSEAIRASIRNAGAKLAFLPPYSPDLNPNRAGLCEGEALDAHGASTLDRAIHDRIAELVIGISHSECASYIRNAGYAST